MCIRHSPHPAGRGTVGRATRRVDTARRIVFHARTMTDDELHYILDAIEEVVLNVHTLGEQYAYSPRTNTYHHKSGNDSSRLCDTSWFTLDHHRYAAV
jgi:hypothetical protein